MNIKKILTFAYLPIVLSACGGTPTSQSTSQPISEPTSVVPGKLDPIVTKQEKALNKENIESRPVWKPMHMQPVFSENDFVSNYETSVGEQIFKRGLCLPSDIKMTVEQQETIIKVIRSCFNA